MISLGSSDQANLQIGTRASVEVFMNSQIFSGTATLGGNIENSQWYHLSFTHLRRRVIRWLRNEIISQWSTRR